MKPPEGLRILAEWFDRHEPWFAARDPADQTGDVATDLRTWADEWETRATELDLLWEAVKGYRVNSIYSDPESRARVDAALDALSFHYMTNGGSRAELPEAPPDDS